MLDISVSKHFCLNQTDLNEMSLKQTSRRSEGELWQQPLTISMNSSILDLEKFLDLLLLNENLNVLRKVLGKVLRKPWLTRNG